MCIPSPIGRLWRWVVRPIIIIALVHMVWLTTKNLVGLQVVAPVLLRLKRSERWYKRNKMLTSPRGGGHPMGRWTQNLIDFVTYPDSNFLVIKIAVKIRASMLGCITIAFLSSKQEQEQTKKCALTQSTFLCLFLFLLCFVTACF